MTTANIIKILSTGTMALALAAIIYCGQASAQRPPSGGGGGGGGDGGGGGGTAGPAINPDDYFEFTDHNGVDVSNGQYLSAVSVDGGAGGSLTFRRGFNWEFWLERQPASGRGNFSKVRIMDGLSVHVFSYLPSAPNTFVSGGVEGATLKRLPNGDYEFIDRDGNIIIFPPGGASNKTGVAPQARIYAKYKQMASGLRYNLRVRNPLRCVSEKYVVYPYGFPHPTSGVRCSGPWQYVSQFLGVEANNGFFVKIDYEDYSPVEGRTFQRPKRYIIGNRNSSYCDVLADRCDLDNHGYNWLSLSGDGLVDKLGRRRYTTTTTAADGRQLRNLIDFGRSESEPVYSIDRTQITDNVGALTGITGSCELIGRIRKIGVRRFITIDGTSTYNITEADCEPLSRAARAVYPDGSSRFVRTELGYGGSGRPTISVRRPGNGMASANEDGINRITRYEWASRKDLAPIAGIATKDSVGTRLLKVTFPEGNYIEFDYDDRRNVTEQRVYPKPGSSDAPLITRLNYPIDCDNPKTCNKPISSTDAKGNVTNYEYAPEHGGITRILGPAVNGVRPETRYIYAKKRSWIQNANGNFVQAAPSIWLIVKEVSCTDSAMTSANSCANSSDLVTTDYQYEEGNASIGSNLWLLGTAVTAVSADGQNETLRTCFTYDEMGRQLSTTQPKGTGSSCP